MPPALSAISGQGSYGEDLPPATHHTSPDLWAISEKDPVPYQCSSPTILATGNKASHFEKRRSTAIRRSTFPAQKGRNLAGSPKDCNDVEKHNLRKSNTAAAPGLKSRLPRFLYPVARGSDDIKAQKAHPDRNSTVYSKASASFEETALWDRKAILSLDGGGIRGYSALLILRAIMKEIGELERKYPEKSATSDGPAASSYHPLSSAGAMVNGNIVKHLGPIVEDPIADTSSWLPCHYFDYMAGTSTGGLISIMIGRLRMNIDDCISEYEKLGAEVFGRSRWFHIRSLLWWPRDKYNHRVLENVIKDVVGRRVPKVPEFPGGQNFAFDENRCRVVVITHQQETKASAENEPYLFRTYKNLHRTKNLNEEGLTRNPGLAHDIPIWQVARATSAAPTYFKTVKIDKLKYLDGGFGGYNNPTLEIFDEVRIMNNNNSGSVNLVVSVGTGKKNKVSRWTNSRLSALRYIRYLNFAKEWATESESMHKQMLKEQNNVDFHYFRFNVDKGLDDIKLDEWRARGKIKVTLGKCVGSIRRKFERRARGIQFAGTMDGHEKHANINSDHPKGSTSETQPQPLLHTKVPDWLQPKRKTIEKIAKYTEAYLQDPELQILVKECAKILVEARRQRAKNDPQRWEKTCFNTWYQCTINRCLRGEKEYLDREKLELHLLDKHSDQFRKTSKEDRAKLEQALDDFKISMR